MFKGQYVEVSAEITPAIPVIHAIGGESDTCSVRRPGGFSVIPIAIGELHWLAAIGDSGQEEVLSPLIDIAHAIEPVPEPVDNARFWQRLAILSFFIGWANRRAEEHILAIRRPTGIGGAMLHESKLAGLAAISWNDPYLCLAFALLLLLFFILASRLPFAFGDKG